MEGRSCPLEIDSWSWWQVGFEDLKDVSEDLLLIQTAHNLGREMGIKDGESHFGSFLFALLGHKNMVKVTL